MNKFYGFLDKRVFPHVVAFFAHPLSILCTLLLFGPMVGWQNDVVLILLLNSYMNVGSFGTSQITLREVRLTADEQETRSRETHDAVMEELAGLRRLYQVQAEELAEIKGMHKEIHNITVQINQGIDGQNHKIAGHLADALKTTRRGMTL